MPQPSYSAPRARSMFPYVLLAAFVAPMVARAEPPQFKKGGFLFSVQYGAGMWGLDRAKLESQVGPDANVFIADTLSTHTVGLRAGYNILGHATIAADFTATGWDLTTEQRGGAGFLTGTVTWHPLELVWLKKEVRPLPIDVGTFFGVGYGIAGENRGMDGVVLQWGVLADYFFSRYFGVGLFARGSFLQWDKYYFDYYGRANPGATVALPQGSGGAFWHLGLALHFRAGD